MSTPAQRWSALHHGIDPAGVPLLAPWLRLMWRLARPLARVPPTALTALGLALALTAVPLARGWPWIAAGVVVAAVFCDGLDGAVAVLADRATSSGARADAVADRLAELAFAAVLWRCGVPWAAAAGCGVLAVSVDGVRRRRNLPARLTVAERPTWTVCTVLACGSAAVTPAQWPVLVCAGVWAGAGLLGVAQLVGPQRR